MAIAQASPVFKNNSFHSRARIWLFSGLCFVLPMRASYIYSFSVLLLLVWIMEGNIPGKIRSILSSKLCLAFLAYFFAYLLAMLWTENITSGWKMVGRQIPLLLFPLYWSSAEAEHKERYISSFLAGLCICAVLAYYNLIQSHWLPEWPRGIQVHKSVGDTAPFVDWIMYSPLLALGAYFSLYRIVFDQKAWMRAWSLIIFCLLTSNLVFSGGRAGMIMFAALCIALIFERTKARIKALLICAFIFPVAIAVAYNSVDFFAARVNSAISDFKKLDENRNTSIGGRLVYWTIGYQLFAQNPVLGVGSGDFQQEYAKIKPTKWSTTADSFNPHNQYLMTGATTGMLGLVPLLLIFYFAFTSKTDKRIKSLLFGYAVLCIFESYLWRSNTSLAFSVLLATLTSKQKVEQVS